MKFTPSVNIEQNTFDENQYIVTPNAKCVVGNIIDSYNSGIHSFNVIGSYGTGKSSFILALENNLLGKSSKLIQNHGQFGDLKRFHFLNVVGDYASLPKVIMNKLNPHNDSNQHANFFEELTKYYSEIEKKKGFLFIVIDEFGKVLEYAAKNNPERELYFFQKFAEFVNSPKHKIILLTTLHQNFNSYAKALTQEQRNEWIKVKGRFKEIVFNEPVEQLLYLASERLEKAVKPSKNTHFEELYELAIRSKFASSSIKYETASKLYPLDLFAAHALTLSIQRYGQNERSLFSFLEAKGENSVLKFQDSEYRTFSLSDVYDYAIYNFFTYLTEANADSMSWTAIRVALEKVEGFLDSEIVQSASRLVKTIGMLNLFGKAGISFDKEALINYAKYALAIANPVPVLEKLVQYKIVRFAVYKSQYILFEGTDINIEDEILKAAGIVPKTIDFVEKLKSNFNFRIESATAEYYKKGTPRYFEYQISDVPISLIPKDEVDGVINLIFNISSNTLSKVIEASKQCKEAILYVYFKNSDKIVDHLWQLDKLDFVLNSIIDDKDYVANREIKKLIDYEKEQLNNTVINSLYTYNENVAWVYKGEKEKINSQSSFKKVLSAICEDVYSSTPIFINELANKHKPSGAISTARVNYLKNLLENSAKELIGFEENKFPPEKTIYLSLLNKTGIHRQRGKSWILGQPQDESFQDLWEECERFLNSTKDKARKIGELIKVLKSRPFKLKQGFLNFWLPTYLIVKKNDYSLFDSEKRYLPVLNKEVLDLLQKSPAEFSIKAFNVEGVKLDLFQKYREAVNLNQDEDFSTRSLIETIRPFLIFYKRLNVYAKHTKKFNHSKTLKFRDILSKAVDPEKTFFEDLPRAMGFKETVLTDNAEVLKRYVEIIQTAIRDLRNCYSELIDRIENALIEALNLKSTEFKEYKLEIENRYKGIKNHLLTSQQRTFLNRILSPFEDRTLWLQSLAYVVLDKQLESILDEEEEYLIDNLVYLFNELFKYVELSEQNISKEDHFYRFEMISNAGKINPQVLRLNSKNEEKSKMIEQKINDLLSGDTEVDVYALLTVIKSKLNDE